MEITFKVIFSCVFAEQSSRMIYRPLTLAACITGSPLLHSVINTRDRNPCARLKPTCWISHMAMHSPHSCDSAGPITRHQHCHIGEGEEVTYYPIPKGTGYFTLLLWPNVVSGEQGNVNTCCWKRGGDGEPFNLLFIDIAKSHFKYQFWLELSFNH